jgi:hypothetical protein
MFFFLLHLFLTQALYILSVISWLVQKRFKNREESRTRKWFSQETHFASRNSTVCGQHSCHTDVLSGKVVFWSRPIQVERAARGWAGTSLLAAVNITMHFAVSTETVADL